MSQPAPTGSPRTLVVSDLHLGTPSGRDVLRQADARAALQRELARTQRLILLGDVVELRYGPIRPALEAATEVLSELARALPEGAEVVLVPGNHDHHLLAPWLERRARDGGPPALGLETAVTPSAGDPVQALVDALAPARVRVAYPGVWLRPDVYATHGHYTDRHTTVPMLERLAAGAMARIVTQPAGGPERIEDYESTLAPVYAWIHALGQTTQASSGSRGTSARVWRALAGSGDGQRGLRRWRRHGLAAAFPALVWLLNRAGIGPVRPQLSPGELRRAGLRAMREVSLRLGVGADYVIFGHTHRAGPLPRDDDGEWSVPNGQRLVNAGSWVLEPGFLGTRPQQSPYRAGFAVRVHGEDPPQLTNLLEPPAGPPPG